MVAENRHHAPAALRRRPLEPDDEVERASHARAAVDEVADLYQHRLATHPGTGGVDNAGLLEDLLERGEIAVDIADRHHARRCGCGCGGEGKSEADAEGGHERPPTAQESDPEVHCEDSTECRGPVPGFNLYSGCAPPP